MNQYDSRGEAEVEQFRSDKSGLGLEARRERSFLGQKEYILLCDLTHNLLTEYQHRDFADTTLGGFGLKRIVCDLLVRHTEPALLAELAEGRLREKHDVLEKALHSLLNSHRFMLAQHLSHVDVLDVAIEQLDARICEKMRPFEATLQRRDSLPGINRRIAEILIAEVGVDFKPFEHAEHLASWVGMCPGNNQNARKRTGGKTRNASKWLRRALIESAHGAAHTQKYFQALFRHFAVRRGKHKAVVAVGHSLLVAGYYLITRQTTYQNLGAK